MDAHAPVVAVGTASRTLADGRVCAAGGPGRTTPGFLRWLMHVGNPLVWSSMMIRGEAARALAPFSRDARRYAEDFDLYHRLGAVGDVARLDEVLTTYRSHAAGASQRHRARMQASARAVLAEAYAPVFGARAEACAALVGSYLAGRQSVPDLATLEALGDVLGAITRALAVRFPPDAESCGLIAREMSRQWWGAARAGIRAGRLGVRGVLACRPDFAERADFGAGARMSSGVVGWARGWAGGRIGICVDDVGSSTCYSNLAADRPCRVKSVPVRSWQRIARHACQYLRRCHCAAAPAADRTSPTKFLHVGFAGGIAPLGGRS